MDCNQSYLIKDRPKSDLHNVRRMAETNLSVTQFGPNLPQAITRSSSMVIISKWVKTKCLNTKQERSWIHGIKK